MRKKYKIYESDDDNNDNDDDHAW